LRPHPEAPRAKAASNAKQKTRRAREGRDIGINVKLQFEAPLYAKMRKGRGGGVMVGYRHCEEQSDETTQGGQPGRRVSSPLGCFAPLAMTDWTLSRVFAKREPKARVDRQSLDERRRLSGALRRSDEPAPRFARSGEPR